MDKQIFRDKIISIMDKAYINKELSVIIKSGDVHKEIGGYPGNNHRMPICCDVMYSLMGSNDKIICSPPKRKGANLTIEYNLVDYKTRNELDELSKLLKLRNEINNRALELMNRPLLIGNVGEFICSRIFDIELNSSASQKGHDGIFKKGNLRNKTVNVKFYSRNDRILDLNSDADCDYYLVLIGSSNIDIFSWNIKEIYLFDNKMIIDDLTNRGVKIGIASSIRTTLWEENQIYPNNNNLIYKMSYAQRETISLFSRL